MQMDKEKMQTELKMIIAQGDSSAILPFLEKYKQGNVDILKATLNDIRRYWWNHKDFPNNLEFNPHHNLSRYATPQQNFCISLFAFGLLNISDIKTSWDNLYFYLSRILYDSSLLDTFIILKPTWVTELLKQLSKKDNNFIYHDLRLLEKQKIIEFDSELFALSISSIPLSHKNIPLNTNEIIEKYTSDEIIYKRDIPLLLDYETKLQNQEHGTWQDKKYTWHDIFIKLVDEQKIDRLFMIRKILEIQSKNWNILVKNFFKRILAEIEPTTAEFLKLQDQLFLLLHSEYSSTVNFAVDTLKPLLSEADFKFTEYLTWLEAVMMRADVKNSVKNILIQMSSALSKHPELQINILNLVADSLLQNDFNLQERAAKILVKYVKPEYDTVIDKIQMYQDHLIGGVSVLLKSYLNLTTIASTPENKSQDNHQYHYKIPQPKYLNPEKKINLPQTWQELLFFMGETIQSSSPLNFDIFMSSWLILKPQFPKDYIIKLKPLIKQMEKGTNHTFQNFFQHFFIAIYHEPNKSPERHHPYLQYRIKFTKNYHILLEDFAQFSYEEMGLPLVSLPTHAPSYIDPEILVQRLLAYQQANVEFNLVDLAIALCRTPRENIEPALVLLSQIRNPALRELLSFALGQTKDSSSFESRLESLSPTQKKEWHGLWETVAQTHDLTNKSDQFLPYQFTSSRETIFNQDTRQLEYIEIGKYVRFSLPESNPTPTYIYQSLCFEMHRNLTGIDLVFYRHFTPLHQTPNDLDFSANDCYCVNELSDYDISPLLLRMIDEDYILNPYSLFILTAYSFSPNKEIRLTVSEVLIQCLSQQKIDLEILAKHYVTLLESNYAPFPRLLECLLAIKGSSELGDQALLIIIMNIIQNYTIPEKPPSQSKKLFELYYELAHQYGIKLPKKSIDSLLLWQDKFNSLKTMIQKIIKEIS